MENVCTCSANTLCCSVYFGNRSPWLVSTSARSRAGSSMHRPRTLKLLFTCVTARCRRSAKASGVSILSKTENCSHWPTAAREDGGLCVNMKKYVFRNVNKLRELGNSLIRLGIISSKLVGRCFERGIRKLRRNSFLHGGKVTGGPGAEAPAWNEQVGAKHIYWGNLTHPVDLWALTCWANSPVTMYFLMG